jgi:hypothetical protein
LAIVDPHHHLCERDEHRYLIRELLADTGSGHNITRTGSMYRAEGPVEMKPVGRKKRARFDYSDYSDGGSVRARWRSTTVLRGRRAPSPNSAALSVEMHSPGGSSGMACGRFSSSSPMA